MGATDEHGGRVLRAIVLLLTLSILTGCSSPGGLEQTDETPPSPSPASSSAQSSESAAARFRAMDAHVGDVYSDRQPAGNFTGSTSVREVLPAPTSAEARKVVLFLQCTGTGEYSITVEQDDPNTVGATCGEAGSSIAAVPLSDPAAETPLEVSIPAGSDFWLATYYTSQ